MEERRRRSELQREREVWEVGFTTQEACRVFLQQLRADDVPILLGDLTTVRMYRNDFEQLPESSSDVYRRSIIAGVVTHPAGPAPRSGPNSRRRMPTAEEGSELSGQYAVRLRLLREGRQ